jgi:hypothetical protein
MGQAFERFFSEFLMKIDRGVAYPIFGRFSGSCERFSGLFYRRFLAEN